LFKRKIKKKINLLKIYLLFLIETFSNNYNFSTIHFQITWYGCDISFPYCLVKYNILHKYPMSSLKKLVITGGPFTKKTQETLAKMMPNTQILNCYGKINQIVKSERSIILSR